MADPFEPAPLGAVQRTASTTPATLQLGTIRGSYRRQVLVDNTIGATQPIRIEFGGSGVTAAVPVLAGAAGSTRVAPNTVQVFTVPGDATHLSYCCDSGTQVFELAVGSGE